MPILNFVEKTIDFYFSVRPRKRPGQLSDNSCIIAHRGAHDKKLGLIENTHDAFVHALQLGCYGIEFDIHATKDEVLVVNHDPTLNRLWGQNKAIKDLTFKELRSLVPQILTLEEVILQFGKKLHLFIELKEPFKAEKILKENLKTLNASEDYHILSLSEPLFASLTLFSPEVLLLVAVHNNLTTFCKAALLKNYGGVLGHYLLFNKKLIHQLQMVGKKIGIGFVDSKYALYRELNRNVSWLFTNKAALVTKHLKELKS